MVLYSFNVETGFVHLYCSVPGTSRWDRILEGEGGSPDPASGPDDGHAHQDDARHSQVVKWQHDFTWKQWHYNITTWHNMTWQNDMKWKQWHDAPSLILHYRAAKCKLLKSWHNLDVNVARYHFESCDNAKFLGAMEKYVHAIYLEVFYLFSIFNISILNLWIYCKGPNGHERSPEKTFKPCENDL